MDRDFILVGHDVFIEDAEASIYKNRKRELVDVFFT